MAVKPSVRKPVKTTDHVLQLLELQHAVLLILSAEHPDIDLEALNNDARALLERAWAGRSLSPREAQNGS